MGPVYIETPYILIYTQNYKKTQKEPRECGVTLYYPYVKYSLAHNMRQGKNSHCAVKKSDAPEEIDLWTAW